MQEKIIRPIEIDRLIGVSIDLQIDFISGSLAVSGSEEIISPINKLNRIIRTLGGIVVLTCDNHPPVTAHFDRWPIHCVEGSEGQAFHPNLQIDKKDIIIEKGTSTLDDGYSGFDGHAKDGITLEQIIAPRYKGERVGVYGYGIATEYCDEATMIDGIKRFSNNSVHFAAVADAMRAVNLQPNDGERALKRMKKTGIQIVSLAEVFNNEVFDLKITT